MTTDSAFSPLDATAHAHVKVNHPATFSHLAGINNTSILAEEVAEVAADCPVVLLKNETTGRFQLTALFGLSADENLLLDHNGKWLGTYMPVGLDIAPFGFFIDNEEANRLQIDMRSPFLSEQEGKALFKDGQESLYLQQMREHLENIHDASLQTEAFIESLVNRNLITECHLILEQENTEPQVIGDFYTINTAEFSYMMDSDVLNFHKMGYWNPIYSMKQSLNQFKRLATLKQARDNTGTIKVLLRINRDEE